MLLDNWLEENVEEDFGNPVEGARVLPLFWKIKTMHMINVPIHHMASITHFICIWKCINCFSVHDYIKFKLMLNIAHSPLVSVYCAKQFFLHIMIIMILTSKTFSC